MEPAPVMLDMHMWGIYHRDIPQVEFETTRTDSEVGHYYYHPRRFCSTVGSWAAVALFDFLLVYSEVPVPCPRVLLSFFQLQIPSR